MFRSVMISLALTFSYSVSAFAENLPANNCQIFIRRLQAIPSSHGSAALNVVVKVNWLGDDEYIQNVGFYATNLDTDLGNSPSCSWNARHSGSWYVQSASSVNMNSTEYGEYLFRFQISSGSVAGECPGYFYSTAGSFFVETNKNTYWLNPEMNPKKNFYFDYNAFQIIANKGGTYTNVFTDRNDMSYYNPQNCHR